MTDQAVALDRLITRVVLELVRLFKLYTRGGLITVKQELVGTPFAPDVIETALEAAGDSLPTGDTGGAPLVSNRTPRNSTTTHH